MLNFVFYSSIIISRRLVPDIKDGKEIIAIALSIIKKLSGVIILKDEVNNEQLPQDGEKYDPGVCQSRTCSPLQTVIFQSKRLKMKEVGTWINIHTESYIFLNFAARGGV